MRKGSKMSIQTKLKISLTMRGVPKSLETRSRMSIARIGKPLSEEHRIKLIGRTSGMHGKKHSLETREKMSLSAKGRIISPEQREKIAGAKNWNWKGGTTPEDKKIRASQEFKDLRKLVFKRDAYKCVLCGYDSKGTRPPDIHIDHIKPFALFPDLRFTPGNCRTLCVPCHKSTDTYGFRTKRP